jgi:uncharacterized repeat protein (TIGR01451 family)
VTVSGSGFVAGDTLTPAFTDANNTKTTYPAVSAASDGTFSTAITIPSGAAQGTGTVSVGSGASGTYSAPFTVTMPSADLGVVVKGCADVNCAPWIVGHNAGFAVTVTNHGPDGAVSINLSDQVPADTTFVSATQSAGPTFTCSTGGSPDTTTCITASFPSGSTAKFELTYNLSSCPSQGSVGDTATVSSTTNDPNPSNNTSGDDYLCQ